MKTLSISLLVALGLVAAVGCAAPAEEGEVAGEETAPPVGEPTEEHVGSESASLINTSSGGTGWSASCKVCKDQCDTDYPRGGGPLQTCKKLCVLAGTCTTTTGPGIGPIMF